MDHRRAFLMQCGLALATAGLGTKFLLDGHAPTPSGPVAAMTRRRFDALVNQRLAFHDRLSGKRMIARLTEIRDHSAGTQLEQFSVIFRGQSPLPEGVYRVTAPSAEAFDLFIIPAGGDEAAWEYRADFSLLA